MATQKILLIDGNSIAFKAYFALPKYSFINHSGLHTNAIYGFHTMLDSVMSRLNPSHVLVAFDAGKTTFRTQQFSDYKGGRPSTEPELREQFAPLRQMIDYLGIKHYELPNYEADDIIGTVAKQAENAGFEVIVLSGDRDLTQLASEKTTVEISLKGTSETEIYTPAYVNEKLGITPSQIIDMKGLAGDKSDNIPGVTKIGEKTAIKLLKEYETVEGIYAHIDELKASKMKENLVNEQETALLSKQLATIYLEAPVELTLDELLYEGAQEEKLAEFYQENDFQSFLDKLNTKNALPEEDFEFEVVSDFTKDMVAQESSLIIEMMGESYHTEDILGISWFANDKAYVANDVSILENADFIDWLQDEASQKYVYDLKANIVALKRYGIDLGGAEFDVLLANYLLHANDKLQDLAFITRAQNITRVASNEEIYGKGVKKAQPEDDVFLEYLGKKAKAVYQLKELLEKEIDDLAMHALLFDMEQPLAKVLAQMELTGVKVVPQTLHQMQADLGKRIEELQAIIYEQAGVEFNINSPKQLGTLLFETLGYDVKLYSKKTKTGYSTSAEVLEKMSGVAPIVDLILNFREISKLKSTYVDGLLKVIALDGKIHTRYQQALTATGRLSSIEPNLQNIPIRSEEGRSIRKAFVPSQEDWVIYASDYSQIELRVLAHITDDQHLKEAFVEGQDIHASTAMRVFGIENAEDVTANDRRNAKAVNFGVVYGISEWGLAKNLGIDPMDAKKFIDTYFEKYPGIKEYMTNVVRDARDKGYVETLWERRRYLPEINERHFARRAFAERTAINSPIQGSAADILKIAMNKLADKLANSKLRANMLLQVHDELIFEVHKDDVEELDKLVRHEMETAVELKVPLVADSNWGETWYDAK